MFSSEILTKDEYAEKWGRVVSTIQIRRTTSVSPLQSDHGAHPRASSGKLQMPPDPETRITLLIANMSTARSQGLG